MIGPFASVQRKMRQHAANWLELAEKVEHYRRDILDAADLASLRERQQTVRHLLKTKADASKLKIEIEALEEILRVTGGSFYPKRSLVEYVEFFLVAAIVILGIRAYFFQPFKIPTNSMWPSYNGMTGEVFATAADEPGVIMQGLRFVTQLAVPKRLDATRSGEVRIPVARASSDQSFIPYETISGRKWFVLPTQLRLYRLFVDDQPVELKVPGDFDLDRVVLDAFFDGAEDFPLSVGFPIGQARLVPTGKQVRSGERILAFDILTGDQLFVDRISYHFAKPEVGDGFVFRTKNLRELHPMMRGPNDQYYIKRLVGVPGDTLEIQEPVLLRNGAPIEGSNAFEGNATRSDRYPGYRHEGHFGPGDQIVVPEHQYLAMGDNSASSLDGRYWGAIPAQDVVGRPLFIYYPFTKRWGPAP
jgi:signal peptidase I